MSSGIYCILCTANGKRYVGQSGDVHRRLKDHLSSLLRGRHHNAHLQAAFQTYGAESFETSVLELCEEGMRDIRERTWISYLHATNHDFGFNHESGGTAQKHLAAETRARISALKMGKPRSEETRRRMSEAKLGKPFSKERCRRMSEAARANPLAVERCRRMAASNIGKPRTEETRRRLSEAARSSPLAAEHRRRMAEANRGKPLSVETRAKLSKAMLGKPQSAAHHANRLAAIKLYWARKKAAATHHEGDK